MCSRNRDGILLLSATIAFLITGFSHGDSCDYWSQIKSFGIGIKSCYIRELNRNEKGDICLELYQKVGLFVTVINDTGNLNEQHRKVNLMKVKSTRINITIGMTGCADMEEEEDQTQTIFYTFDRLLKDRMRYYYQMECGFSFLNESRKSGSLTFDICFPPTNMLGPSLNLTTPQTGGMFVKSVEDESLTWNIIFVKNTEATRREPALSLRVINRKPNTKSYKFFNSDTLGNVFIACDLVGLSNDGYSFTYFDGIISIFIMPQHLNENNCGEIMFLLPMADTCEDMADCYGFSLGKILIEVIEDTISLKTIKDVMINANENCEFEIVSNKFQSTPFYSTEWTVQPSSSAGNCSGCMQGQEVPFSFKLAKKGPRVVISAKGSLSPECSSTICEVTPEIGWRKEKFSWNETACLALTGMS